MLHSSNFDFRISPDPQTIDCLRNGHFGSIDLEPGLSHTVGPAGDAGSIDKTDINDTVIPENAGKVSSGVKRPTTDDHSYMNQKGQNASASNSNDHEYSCHLYTEEEEEDDEDVNFLCHDRMKDLLKMLNLKSNTDYDYASMLRMCSQTDLSEQDIFMGIIQEMKTRCPHLLETLVSVCVKDETKVNLRQITSVAVAYSCLMFARNNKNSGIQRCITMLAVKGDANDEFIRRLNRMSLSLSCSGKLRILDKAVIASHNMLVEAIRTNPLMKITGDNLDMYIRTNHQRTDNSNQDIHWFASNAFFTRLNYQNLPENTPEVRLKDIDAEMFVLNESETLKLNDVQKVLIGRLLCDRDEYQWLKNKLPQHIPHRYKIQSKYREKNEITPVLNGMGNTDVLDKYGVVLGGDMLTRERLQNAKNITYLAPTPKGRFEHLSPVTCELWHVKQDLLSKAYKALFKSDSLGECGTLFHMKTALRRNDVNGNVKSNYKAHEELFLLIVKALIHIASDEIKDCREQNRDIVLSSVFSKIYGLGYSTDDYVYNYFTNLLTWGMQIVNMNDTAKEGDMERLIMNMKENAAFFYSHSAMRANKTENGSRRASSSADIIHRIGDNIDHLLNIPKLTTSHAKKTSSKDLEIAINILNKVQPFNYVKGRQFESFKTIAKNPKLVVQKKDLVHAIQKKIQRLFLNS
ncbi:unnamed protein product [Mytilus coruscus]|uniref:DUF6589 domain-containing protein n=1 Tax=Mytilus coruscus TaxID=42192 RepID=A0A6J8D9N6_MYTCO|nr:unnamed protein product [Mytilus coruscus]